MAIINNLPGGGGGVELDSDVYWFPAVFGLANSSGTNVRIGYQFNHAYLYPDSGPATDDIKYYCRMKPVEDFVGKYKDVDNTVHSYTFRKGKTYYIKYCISTGNYKFGLFEGDNAIYNMTSWTSTSRWTSHGYGLLWIDYST